MMSPMESFRASGGPSIYDIAYNGGPAGGMANNMKQIGSQFAQENMARRQQNYQSQIDMNKMMYEYALKKNLAQGQAEAFNQANGAGGVPMGAQQPMGEAPMMHSAADAGNVLSSFPSPSTPLQVTGMAKPQTPGGALAAFDSVQNPPSEAGNAGYGIGQVIPMSGNAEGMFMPDGTFATRSIEVKPQVIDGMLVPLSVKTPWSIAPNQSLADSATLSQRFNMMNKGMKDIQAPAGSMKRVSGTQFDKPKGQGFKWPWSGQQQQAAGDSDAAYQQKVLDAIRALKQ